MANHPELVDEMEEQVSLALAARLARAEEENYYLSERVCAVHMVCVYIVVYCIICAMFPL